MWHVQDVTESDEDLWVVSSVGAHLLAWARREGMDLQTAIDSGALEPQAFSAGGRVPARSMQSLWASLVTVSTDPAFALRSGAAAAPAIIPVLGPTMVASSSIFSAMSKLAEHHGVVSNSASVALERDGDEVRLRCRWRGGIERESPWIVESAASHWVVFQEALTGDVFTPKRIVFPFERPAHGARHTEFFGCDIQYGGEFLLVAWAAADADRGFLTHDPMVLRYLDEALVALPRDRTKLSHRVLALLTQIERPASVSATTVAEHFAVSTRSFQRKLAAEGLSYRMIADRALRKRAEGWLADKSLSIDEVVWRLGYAKRSSFHRAFVRWNGVTPALWRTMT